MNDTSASTPRLPFPVSRLGLPPELSRILERAPSVILPQSREHLLELALGGPGRERHEVAYRVGEKTVVEAEVVRVKNGLSVNYLEPYMRRRDPDSMVIGDAGPTDQPRFSERFDVPFASLRKDVLTWLEGQELLVLPFWAGGDDLNLAGLLICPSNAGFFAGAAADLQSPIFGPELPASYSTPRAVLLVAPPFRHTHCRGRQVVVHNRTSELHEILSLNLYPGPSAKKGVYGVLLNVGEQEKWLTAHGSTVRVVTPYDNTLTILHEGASGSGKSEMTEYAHREIDGRLRLGRNTVTGETRFVSIPQGCALQPVTDDMALCHPSLQSGGSKLVVRDAEAGWFVRVNHITNYGTDHQLERLTVSPPRPLLFLNMQGVPDATCLIWEHTEDSPGKRCPNPRVILPRDMVPDVVSEPVEVDVRSFGVRCPPCTSASPSYGILGLFHVLPAPLAWLWRLVAPRGHDNPSIVTEQGLQSEGIGSFWPFATGKRTTLANLLLRQILSTPSTRHVLIPNQNVGAWNVGFMPQWLTREFLARRGGVKFRPEQVLPARSPLLGYTPKSIQIEGVLIPKWFTQVHTQPEVGNDAYDAGARILQDFFAQELKPLLEDGGLDPEGRKIIQWCLDGGALSEIE